MTRRVTVTGGCGWIGGWVVRELVEHGWAVTVLDRERPPHHATPRGLQPAVPGVRYRIGNHENLGDLIEVFAGADAAIHLAAIASPGTFPDTHVFTTNVVGNFNACEAAAVLGLKALAMASSINTLGQGYRTHLHLPDFVPVDETHANRPQDPYGLSKLLGELTAEQIHRRTAGKLRVVSIRPSLVARPWDYPNMETHFKTNPLSGERALFSYTDPRDLAAMFRLAIESDNPEAACTELYAVQDDSWGLEPTRDLIARAYPGTENIPGMATIGATEAGISNSRAKRLLGWKATRSWRNSADYMADPSKP